MVSYREGLESALTHDELEYFNECNLGSIFTRLGHENPRTGTMIVLSPSPRRTYCELSGSMSDQVIYLLNIHLLLIMCKEGM